MSILNLSNSLSFNNDDCCSTINFLSRARQHLQSTVGLLVLMLHELCRWGTIYTRSCRRASTYTTKTLLSCLRAEKSKFCNLRILNTFLLILNFIKSEAKTFVIFQQYIHKKHTFSQQEATASN